MPDLVALRLADPTWLAARLDETGRAWGCADARVRATLWWYAASSVIAFPLVSESLAQGFFSAPAPDRGWLGDAGQLGGLVSLPGRLRPDALPEVFACFSPTIDALALLGGLRPAPLWAVLGDSIATRALDAARGRTPADPMRTRTLDVGVRRAMARASVLAADIAEGLRHHGYPVPLPRFVDVAPRATRPASAYGPVSSGAVRVVRRASCCLIHLTTATPDDPRVMCASCPRLHPADRRLRMMEALWNHPSS